MNRYITLFTVITVVLIITACNNAANINGLPGHIEINEPWAEHLTLSWNDEFNEAFLDSSKWQAPNDIERQGGSHWMSNQVSVSNGVLRLGIDYNEKEFNDDPGVVKENYDCGAVRTKKAWTTGEELFVQTYGYFEARAKLPANISADYWAAFWMMSGEVSDGQPYTQLGHEIDIMESFTISNGGEHKLTLHWNGYGSLHNNWSLDCGTHSELQDGEFHVYGLYWDQDKFISYIDGVEVGRTDFINKGDSTGGKTVSNGPTRQPAYIKLTCEAAAWPGSSSGWESTLPQSDEFLVDYVRVYTGTVQ